MRGEIRVVKPGHRLRTTWQPDGREKPATLQLTLVPKSRGVSFNVHMERLPDAKQKAFDSIEVFYNQQRMHSAIGYAAPAEFERAEA